MPKAIPHPPLLPRLAAKPFATPAARSLVHTSAPLPTGPRASLRAGIICNPKSHRNRSSVEAARPFVCDTALVAAPRTKAELAEVLATFHREAIELLVIDGGDGTVRDVLSAGAALWDDDWPRLAIVPSGKTNALALDLGVPADWTLQEALTAAQDGGTVVRRPLDIVRADGTAPQRGFLLGAGAFVSATALAQRTHRAGAFNGIAVALALGWAVAQTLFGRATSPWRVGDPMAVRFTPDAANSGNVQGSRSRYLLLASTLQRMPLGIKPFGRPRAGLKTLLVDAPPRWLAAAAPLIVAGTRAGWLAGAGYHRLDSAGFDLSMASGFILDGEVYPGGVLTIGQAPPIGFVVP